MWLDECSLRVESRCCRGVEVFGDVWLSVGKFCECIVRRLRVPGLCR